MADTFETKLGTTTKAGPRTRIWLEGARLVAHGFNPGDRFERVWTPNGLQLERCGESHFETLARDAKGTVSGKGDKPIIDIVGARVASTFTGERVSVTYRPRKIIITNP